MLPQKYHASFSNMLSQPLKNVSQNMKTNINFSGQAWVRPPCKVRVKGFILPHKHHATYSYSGLLQLIKNAKTNNNIVDYNLVSRRVILTISYVQRVYICSKRTFILPQKQHVSILNMLSQLLRCVTKKKNNINFRD